MSYFLELKSWAMASTAQALVVVAVTLVVMYVSRKLLSYFFQQPKLKLPPGPTPWPIVGSLHLLDATHPHKSLANMARIYGPVMSLHMGQKLYVVASSPDAAQEFLKLQDANFSSRPSLRAAEIINPQDLIFHDLTPVFRHLRKTLVTELTSAKRLEASKFIRTEELAHMLRTISHETGPIRLNTYISIMSSNIISRMVLSKRFLGAEDESNVSEIHEFMDIVDEMAFCYGAFHLHDIFNFIPTWFDLQGLDNRCHKLRARMDVFYSSMMDQHKEERRRNPISEDQKTLVDVLLEQLDNPDHRVTEEHIKGLTWDSLAAGSETSTLTSEWAMAELLKNPKSMEEARLELDRVVGNNRIVDESDIHELKYIQAVVKETFRLHPVVPLLIPHHNINTAQAFGYDIPAKTTVIVNAWNIGRDPDVWKKPLQFVPERFLEGATHGTTGFQEQQFELIPFGSGRRLCPGMKLGLNTVHIQVANLVHAFDWSLPEGMTPENLDMTEGVGIAIPMKNSLVAIAKPRLPSHLY